MRFRLNNPQVVILKVTVEELASHLIVNLIIQIVVNRGGRVGSNWRVNFIVVSVAYFVDKLQLGRSHQTF
jgi:hypothetical protein